MSQIPPTIAEDAKKVAGATTIEVMSEPVSNVFSLDNASPPSTNDTTNTTQQHSPTYINHRNWSGAALTYRAPPPAGSFKRRSRGTSFRQSVRSAASGVMNAVVAEGETVGDWAKQDETPSPAYDYEGGDKWTGERGGGKDEEEPPVVGMKPEDYRKKYVKLPAVVRRPRRVFSTYRRLFTLCFLANVAMLVCVATDVWAGAVDHLGLIVIANIAVTVTIRCELLLNGLYMFATKLPRSAPLGLRLFVSRLLYHIGGIHSGCGTSALMWMIYFVHHISRAHNNAINHTVTVNTAGAPVPSLATVVTSYLLLVATVLQVASAIVPKFRHAYHNTFELMHRFCGWTALALTWVLVFSSARDKVAPLPASNIIYEHILVRQAELWLVVYITIVIVMPWTRMERVPVKTVVPSPHCIAITFPDGPAAGTFGRVSLSPLTEWHSFATISPTKDADEHRMIMAAAGDWTKDVIKNPPTHMYVRRIRCPGFMYTVKMYNRVVLMATGAGIAPVLPHIMQNTTQMFILWVTKNPRSSFGDEITDLVYNSAHRRVWDTAVDGRPDMVGLALQAMEEFGAEALHIVANEPVTKQVVYGLSCRGLTAFGAIWDS